ncbi:HNH endonuclease [Hymenobacter rigui]|uniref:HNH endonuclease n=1 Tax=Hymenobacter rigui TaxID=334424 RepID=A0A428KA12_9BACT|nr:HNH endonuclease [Hymenobacter rigui]RSK43193.1 HNH endonuclease [Hymenobacter rigui]
MRKKKIEWPVAPAAHAGAGQCGLCGREVQHTSRHHLVPREEGGRYGPVVELCQPCHSTIHLLLDNRQLARQYNTIELLREAPELQVYLHWVCRSKVERISNRRPRR